MRRVARIQLICAYEPCAKLFEAMPAEAKRGGVRYCSPTCRSLARRQPRVERVTLICAYEPCGKPFVLKPYEATIWKYCSSACYNAARTPKDDLETFAQRFWAKVDRKGPEDCWLWTATLHAHGYGNFRATPYKPGNVSAHVVSWFLTTGAWPADGLFVCHDCDTPACVAPHHLFLGTHLDNMTDMVKKKRQGHLTHPERILRGDNHPARLHPERMARGDRNGMRLHPESILRGDKSPQTKITEAQWAEALALYATGQWSYTDLAKRYGVTSARIGQKMRQHKASTRI